MPPEPSTFRFEQDFEHNVLPVILGRLQVAGYTIRWYFTPQGVRLTMPKALQDHPAVCWYESDGPFMLAGKPFTGVPPQKEAPHAT